MPLRPIPSWMTLQAAVLGLAWLWIPGAAALSAAQDSPGPAASAVEVDDERGSAAPDDSTARSRPPAADLVAERLSVQELMYERQSEEALRRVDLVLESFSGNDPREVEWIALRIFVLTDLGREAEAVEATRLMKTLLTRQDALNPSAWSPGLLEAIEEGDEFDIDEDANLIQAIAYALLSIPFLLTVFGINLAISRRQSRIGRGSRSRWFGVSAGCTLLGFLPMAIWTGGVLVFPSLSDGKTLGVTIVATIAAHLVLMVTILRPVTLADGRTLMDIDSGPLVDRVARLAHRMNIAPPALRKIPSATSDLDAMAFLSGLPAYTVLVSDGLQLRLTPEEEEAILAHELGHIANGSLWWYALIAPLAASVPVVVSLVATAQGISIDGQLMTLLPLACAVHVGIKRLIGRALEYDCDRRAAAVVGASSTASALQKIHAIGRVPESGLLSWMLHATSVHPSNDERIDTLDWRAPITDLVQVPWRKAEVSRRRWAVRAAAALWVAILAVSLTWILTPDRTWPLLPDALLFTTAGVPFLLLVALQRLRTRFARKQNALRPRGRKVALAIWLASAGGLVWLVATYGLDFLPWSDGMESGGQALFSMAMLVAAGIVLLRFLFVRVIGVPPTTPIDRQILQHLLSRQYSEGLDLARRNAKNVARSPVSRHNVAIIKGIAGDRAGAIQDLRDIVVAGIGPGQSILCLGSLLLDEDRPVDAIKAAQTFRAFLPKDPAGPLLEGEALRMAGRLDEAWNAAEEAERLERGDARTTVLKGRIAITRGDVEDAQLLLNDAERLAPGDFLLLVARFELAKEQGDEAAAWSLLTRIQEHVAAMPVSLYQKRLERMAPCERVEAVSPTLVRSEVLQIEE